MKSTLSTGIGITIAVALMGCVSTRYDVYVVDPIPAHVIDDALPDATRVFEALTPEPVAQVVEGRVIAWAIKAQYSGRLPEVSEEAIVLVRTLAESGYGAWYLGLGTRGTHFNRWGPPAEGDYLPYCQEFSSKPEESVIANFIGATNFGWNEFRTDVDLMRVVLFNDSQVLRRALEFGVSQGEKKRRTELHRRMLRE